MTMVIFFFAQYKSNGTLTMPYWWPENRGISPYDAGQNLVCFVNLKIEIVEWLGSKSVMVKGVISNFMPLIGYLFDKPPRCFWALSP